MQDLASEFSKIFSGNTPDHYNGPPPAPNTQPGLWSGAGRKRPPPGVGTQTLVPLNFLAVVAPLRETEANISIVQFKHQLSNRLLLRTVTD